MGEHDGVSSDEMERRLAIAYAPLERRPAMTALFALDHALASVLRTTREPMVGQMRLTWWHDALIRLDGTPPPAEPVLQGLAREVLPLGVTGESLATMVEGWEELLEPDPLPDDVLERYGRRRGGTLFAAGGVAGSDPLEAAGTGWALVDLARHAGDRELARRAIALATPYLDKAAAVRWSRANRGWGALAHLARLHDTAALQRVGRALWHRVTGL